MGSDSTSRTLVTLVLLALVGWAIWLVRDILPPFLIAFALALLLDPLLDRMQRLGVPRGLAVALTFVAFLALFVAFVALVVPRIFSQVGELVGNVDTYGLNLQRSIDTWADQNAGTLRALNLPQNVAELVRRNQGKITEYVQVGLQRLIAAMQSSVGALGWILVVPIVTLYLLMDLDSLRARLLHLVAAPHREMVAELAAKVGGVFAAYLRGLLLICASYGLIVYLVLVLVFDLRYSLILGVLGGVLYAVPYLGQLTLLVVCCTVAWVTNRGGLTIALVAGSLVLIGQLFDQLITPRVIGRQVGLHPVLGLFALMVGGNLFGLAGMVVAVPVAAAVRVVLIHLFPKLGEPIPRGDMKVEDLKVES